jgi:membrane-associated phospholipid phosphatase
MPGSQPEEFQQSSADFTMIVQRSRINQITHDIASAISTIIHPLLFPLLVVAVVSYARQQDIQITAMLVFATIALTSLPVAALVWIQVKRGAWSDLDVSKREQRYTLYPFSLACLIAVAFMYAKMGAIYAIWCVLALVIANTVNSIINLTWKISAHATTAAACAALLWLLAPNWGPIAALSVISVSWSRVVLRRHTPGQVIAGTIVGMSSAILAIRLLGHIV